MVQRVRPRRYARVARSLVLSLFAMGVAACAAILGIDDREPVEGAGQSDGGDGSIDGASIDGGADAAGDGAIGDGGVDAPDPTKKCADAACADAGGTCLNGSCALACASCNGRTFTCPPDTDCTIGCSGTDSCDSVKCVGGRSCTLDCTGVASCKGGVSCESERCDLLCKGPKDACKDGVVRCDAGVCNVVCSGLTSCNRGVQASASAYCGIACTGLESCNGAMADLRCAGPDASIFCGAGKDICKDNKPSCFADFCAISCNEPSKCDSKDYCCEAGTCAVDAAQVGNNVCP